MAKKSKDKDEEEEACAFVPPKFDENEFMQNEIKKGKTTHFTILLGIGMGCLSLGLTAANQKGLAVFFGFLVMVSMKNYFKIVKVDTDFFEKKEWIGAGGTYIFTWVVIWTLLINPPFSDFSSPDIKRIQVFGIDDDDNWTVYKSSNADTLIFAGEDVRINATITDNIGVKPESIEMVLDPSIQANVSGPTTWETTHLWTLHNVTVGEHLISIISEDTNGHTSSRDYRFTVNADDFNPQIVDVQILGQDQSQAWQTVNSSNRNTLINVDEEVQVNATITDNVGIRTVQLIIPVSAVDSVTLTNNSEMMGNSYVWLLENVTSGQHNFTVRAEDLGGRVATRQYTLIVT
jgi:hypothetical protein